MQPLQWACKTKLVQLDGTWAAAAVVRTSGTAGLPRHAWLAACTLPAPLHGDPARSAHPELWFAGTPTA